ncbi:MAG TPA: S8 family serine peptidase [Niabella sp.]|nr:S8 family serine peptidase [Niabella sp.]
MDIEILPGYLMIPTNQMASQKLVARFTKSGATAKEVNWVSADPNIASVNIDGQVVAKAIGQTIVTASLTNGSGSATVKVFVYDINDYKFRIELKDKGPVTYSFNRPAEFLSSRTVARRLAYNIPIDSSDIPISSFYLQQIEKAGVSIVAQSKWLKTVSVHCSDSGAYNRIKILPFVQSVSLVWTGKKDTASYFKTLVNFHPSRSLPRTISNEAEYGAAWDNININKGQYLHSAGYKGKGMEIAVLDVGFYNFKANNALRNVSVKGAKSFLYEFADPYARGNHGTAVTSCMATNQPTTFVGTAPEAEYWLFVTEDETSEYPIEEDYWVAALEYADSAGVYIANTSLGYKDFDNTSLTHRFEALDGKTTHAAKGASVAAQKGMLLVVSAGNDKTYVATPADSPDVLTVGAIEKSGSISTFSSNGMTTDGRMKPDVLALGTSVALIGPNGMVSSGSGTSFASPILCGMIACLWQAYPKLSNNEIISVVKRSSNRYLTPLLPYGNGIPDMEKAMAIAKSISDEK